MQGSGKTDLASQKAVLLAFQQKVIEFSSECCETKFSYSINKNKSKNKLILMKKMAKSVCFEKKNGFYLF